MRRPGQRLPIALATLLLALVALACQSGPRCEGDCCRPVSWTGWPTALTIAPLAGVPVRAFALRGEKWGLSPVELAGGGTISVKDSQGREVPGSLALQDARFLEFQPAQPLEASSNYSVTVSGASTRCGQAGDFSWTFTAWEPARLDQTFGASGIVIAPGLHPVGLAPTGDGAVILHGFGMVRLDGAGRQDPVFGTTGQVDFSTLGVPYPPGAVTIDDSGRILVATSGFWTGGGGWEVLRFDGTGVLDPQFGLAGVARGNRTGLVVEARLHALPGGAIEAGINERDQSSPLPPADVPLSGALIRLLADGSLDVGFANGGTLAIDGELLDFQPLLDGGLMVLSGDASCAVRLARLDVSGARDATFGSGGSTCVPGLGRAMALRMDASGRMLVAGRPAVGTSGTVIRLTADGQLDPTFGSGGAVELGLAGATFRLAVAGDGRAAVAGALPFSLSWLDAAGTLEQQDVGPLDLGSGDCALAFDPSGRLYLAAALRVPDGPPDSLDPLVLRFR